MSLSMTVPTVSFHMVMSLSMTVPTVSFHMAALMSLSLNAYCLMSLSMTVPTVSFHMAAIMSVFECAYCLMSLSMTVPTVSFHMAALMSLSLNVPTVSCLCLWTVPTVSFHMAALMSLLINKGAWVYFNDFFFCHGHEGNTFCDFLLASMSDKTLPKCRSGDLLLKERICSKGSKLFPLRVDPTEEREIKGRVASHESVTIHLTDVALC